MKQPLLMCPGCNGGIGEDDCRRLQRDLDFSVVCPHCDGRWLYFALTGEIKQDQRPTLEAGWSAEGRESLLARLPGVSTDLGELRENFGDLSWELAREFADWGTVAFHDRALQLGRTSWRAHQAGSPIDLQPAERLMAMRDVSRAAPVAGLPDDVVRSYMHAMLRDLREQLANA